jgi:hypothetical protein
MLTPTADHRRMVCRLFSHPAGGAYAARMASLQPIHRLTAVYHANGGLRGDLAYLYGNLRGTTHCALCDLTHRGVRRRREWTDMLCALDVPVDVVHLDERSPQVAAVTEGHTPCVLGHADAGIVILLNRDDLEAVNGDVQAFVNALDKAAQNAGLRLSSQPQTDDTVPGDSTVTS